MNTYTTPTGIKVLLPQVPIEAKVQTFKIFKKTGLDYNDDTGALVSVINPVFDNLTILGTCWREGGKLICDFDPAQLVIENQWFYEYTGNKIPAPESSLGYKEEMVKRKIDFEFWLLSIGEKIKEGHKIVVIKVE